MLDFLSVAVPVLILALGAVLFGYALVAWSALAERRNVRETSTWERDTQ